MSFCSWTQDVFPFIPIIFDFFQQCFLVFSIQLFTSLVKFIPEYFILFDAVSNVIAFLISFSVQFSSVTQLCLTLCDPMNHITPGLPVHYHLPEFTQAHVHWVSDAIQPSHPLSSPFPSASNPSQHQSLCQWVNSSHEVAKVSALASFLPKNRTDLLQNGLVGSPYSPRDSQESSPTPQFKSINSLALSFLHSPTLTSNRTTGKTIALTRQTFVGNVSAFQYAL